MHRMWYELLSSKACYTLSRQGHDSGLFKESEKEIDIVAS